MKVQKFVSPRELFADFPLFYFAQVFSVDSRGFIVLWQLLTPAVRLGTWKVDADTAALQSIQQADERASE